MKENSIEEDIRNAEHFINSIKKDKEYKEENGWHGYYNKEIVEIARILEHILSDYKKLQEEFKAVDNECSRLEQKENELERENEELRETYKSEKKMKNEYVKLYQDLLLKENIIPKQKIKDKIEELNKKILDAERFDERILEYRYQKQVLQELLESEIN